MKKPILCDIDGVLADFVGGYYEMSRLYKFRDLNKVLPDPNAIRTFYIEDSIRPELRTQVIDQQIHDIVNEVGLFVNLRPIEDVVRGVKRLSEKSGREVFFVSAPHNSAKMSFTEKAIWIENHFGGNWLNNLILTRDKTLVSGIILIDDKPSPMGKFSPDWEHIVFDQTYNRDDIHVKGKRRMFSWSDDQVDSLVQYLEFINEEN